MSCCAATRDFIVILNNINTGISDSDTENTVSEYHDTSQNITTKTFFLIKLTGDKLLRKGNKRKSYDFSTMNTKLMQKMFTEKSITVHTMET